MTQAGEGWRYSLGVFATIYMCLSTIACSILLVWRRNYEPLRTNGWLLPLISTLASLFMIEVPLREVVGEQNFSCDLHVWFGLLWPPAWGLPIICGAIRLGKILDLQANKKAVAREGDDNAALDFDRLIKRQLERVYATAVAIALVPIVIIAAILSQNTTPDYGNTGCSIQGARLWILLVIAAALAIVVLFGWRSLYRHREAFGIRRHYVITLLTTYLFVLVYFILNIFFHDLEQDSFSFAYFVYLTAMLWQAHSVLYPAIMTFPFTAALGRERRTSTFTAQSNFDFRTFLSSPMGQVFFMSHLMRECSPENLLFYMAVESFKEEPTRERATKIFTKYIRPGAPLEVNIAHSFKSRVEALLMQDVKGLLLDKERPSQLSKAIPPELLASSSSGSVIFTSPALAQSEPAHVDQPSFSSISTTAADKPMLPHHSESSSAELSVPMTFTASVVMQPSPSQGPEPGRGRAMTSLVLVAKKDDLLEALTACQQEIYALMLRDSVPRFFGTDLWHEYIEKKNDRRLSRMDVSTLARTLSYRNRGEHENSRLYNSSRQMLEESAAEEEAPAPTAQHPRSSTMSSRNSMRPSHMHNLSYNTTNNIESIHINVNGSPGLDGINSNGPSTQRDRDTDSEQDSSELSTSLSLAMQGPKSPRSARRPVVARTRAVHTESNASSNGSSEAAELAAIDARYSSAYQAHNPGSV